MPFVGGPHTRITNPRWRRKSWTCELGYGADTMFHRTYFLLFYVIDGYQLNILAVAYVQ